jgi:hypothetical protein
MGEKEGNREQELRGFRRQGSGFRYYRAKGTGNRKQETASGVRALSAMRGNLSPVSCFLADRSS